MALFVATQICDPSGFGKPVVLTRDDRFRSPEHAVLTPQFDGTFEVMWPWLAREVIHSVSSFERHDRVRADLWCAMKTGDLAGTPDLVLPLATVFGNHRLISRRSDGNVRAALDLPDVAERVTAFVRLRGLVPAPRILQTWRWASELAEHGEVRGNHVEWTLTKSQRVVHFVNGEEATTRAVSDLGTYWAEISALHEAQ